MHTTTCVELNNYKQYTESEINSSVIAKKYAPVLHVHRHTSEMEQLQKYTEGEIHSSAIAMRHDRYTCKPPHEQIGTLDDDATKVNLQNCTLIQFQQYPRYY